MFRLQPPMRCSAIIALAAMGAGVCAAADTVEYSTSSALVNRTAEAAHEARVAFQETLNRQIRNLNSRYEDTKKELEEEYVHLAHEREEAYDKIFKKVKDIKERQARERSRLDEEYAKIQAEINAGGAVRTEQRHADRLAEIQRRREIADSSHNNSLETLRRQYRLTGQRYNELMRIQSAREAIEEKRFREERDLLSDRLTAENRGIVGATVPQTRGYRIGYYDIDGRQTAMEERYNAQLNALDDYQDLVQKRLKQQNDFEARHAELINKLNAADINDKDRTDYMSSIDKLVSENEIAERNYINELRFLEDRLTLDTRRNRELTRIDAAMRQIESNWDRVKADFKAKEEAYSNRASDLTVAQRDALRQELATAKERYADAEAAYESAVNNINERRKLVEKSLDDRMNYLTERNKIRTRIVRNAANPEDVRKYREELAKLEQRRMDSEMAIRNGMTSLYDTMPADYRTSPWSGGNPEMRRVRQTRRMDMLRQNLQSSYRKAQDAHKNKVEQLNAAIADSATDATRREAYQKQLRDIETNSKTLETQYAQAMKNLEERASRDQRRMADRADYMNKRSAIRREMGSAARADRTRYDRQLRDLDNDWMARERRFRTSEQPLGTLIPSDRRADAVKDRSIDESWNAGVQRIEREQAIAPEHESVWEEIKDAVVDTYHDAVSYFRD